MKRILLPLLLGLVLAVWPVQAQSSYTNPVLHADYSDPDICRVGEDYYMTASSFNCFPGLPVLHSRDLVHWTLVGAALTDYPGAGWEGPEHDFRTQVQHGNGVWAPAIRYHDGWFYIFCGDPDRGIFMVRTQDPRGRWEDPVWVVKAKGFIDPCPLWDEDGKAWLSHAAAGSRAGLKSVLFVAPMAPDGTHLLGPSRIVFDGHKTQPTIEGTKFYKRDGHYYIFAPAGGVSTGWQTVLRSDNPFGPYEERIVMAATEGTINGPHQGGWVETPEGESWFLHFQDKGAYGRIVHLQPMTWNSDGWPLIGEDPDGDGIGQPVDSYDLPVSDSSRIPAAVGPYGLPLDWQYPAVPSPYWHYALPDGGVRLFSVEQTGSPALDNCPNLLLQKFPAEDFVVTARMVFHPHPDLQEQAGFLVTGSELAGLQLQARKEEVRLQFYATRDASIDDWMDLPYDSEREVTLWIKLEVKAKDTGTPIPDAECRFSFSRDGKRFVTVGDPFIASPEHWIGAKFGFYCNRYAPKNDGGWLDVLDFSVR